jgi:hypothetical protein
MRVAVEKMKAASKLTSSVNLVFSLLVLFLITVGLLAESIGSCKKLSSTSEKPSLAENLFKKENRKHQKWISNEIPQPKTKKIERHYGQEVPGLSGKSRESYDEPIRETTSQKKSSGNSNHNLLMTNNLFLPTLKSNRTLGPRWRVFVSAKISKHGKWKKGNANAKPRAGKNSKGKRGCKPKVKIKSRKAGDGSSRVGAAALNRMAQQDGAAASWLSDANPMTRDVLHCEKLSKEREQRLGVKDGELARRASDLGASKQMAEQDVASALPTWSVFEEAVVVMATEDADLSVAGQMPTRKATRLGSDSEIFLNLSKCEHKNLLTILNDTSEIFLNLSKRKYFTKFLEKLASDVRLGREKRKRSATARGVSGRVGQLVEKNEYGIRPDRQATTAVMNNGEVGKIVQAASTVVKAAEGDLEAAESEREAADEEAEMTKGEREAEAAVGECEATDVEAEAVEGKREAADVEVEETRLKSEAAEVESEAAEGEREAADVEAVTAGGERETANIEVKADEDECEAANVEAEAAEGEREVEAEAAEGKSEAAEGECEADNVEAETAEGESEAANVEAEAAEGERETANVVAEAAEGECEAANVEAEAAEGEREAAEVEAEAAEDEREAAEVEAEEAEGEREAANVEAEAAEGEHEAANVEAEAAEDEREAAEVEAEAAEGEREAANVEAEAAECECEASNVEAEAAGGEREAANVEAEAAKGKREADVDVEAAEGECEAPNVEAEAAESEREATDAEAEAAESECEAVDVEVEAAEGESEADDGETKAADCEATDVESEAVKGECEADDGEQSQANRLIKLDQGIFHSNARMPKIRLGASLLDRLGTKVIAGDEGKGRGDGEQLLTSRLKNSDQGVIHRYNRMPKSELGASQLDRLGTMVTAGDEGKCRVAGLPSLKATSSGARSMKKFGPEYSSDNAGDGPVGKTFCKKNRGKSIRMQNKEIWYTMETERDGPPMPVKRVDE